MSGEIRLGRGVEECVGVMGEGGCGRVSSGTGGSGAHTRRENQCTNNQTREGEGGKERLDMGVRGREGGARWS